MEEGWEKAFTVERRRVEEYIELYRSMGYDVKVVDVDTCDRDCSVCYLQGDYVELWIRKSKMLGDEDIC